MSATRPLVRLTADPRVSEYDRVSATLTTAVTLLGVMVLLLFLLWLEPQSTFTSLVRPFPPAPANEGASSVWTDVSLDEFETPETGGEQHDSKVTLETISAAVSTVAVQLAGIGDGTGTDNGDGDGRRPGPGPEDVRPGSKARWQVELTVDGLPQYAELLDRFGITLGAVSQLSNRIEYVVGLSQTAPEVTEGTRSDESRLYFINPRNRLRRIDQTLARRAGVDLDYKLLVHFYPDELRAVLTELELQACRDAGRETGDIVKTRFGVRPVADGYEFFVAEIRFSDSGGKANP